jgi:HEPN domain-containing protein
MAHKESFYPADWLRIAEEDLRRAEHLLTCHDPKGAAFHLQQAIEKFLKAFLLSTGWRLERIHDLELLLNKALAYDPSLEPFRSACHKITEFYSIERYPFIVDVNLTEEDIRGSLTAIHGLVEKIRASFAGRQSGDASSSSKS